MPPAPPSRRAILQALAGLSAFALLPGCTGDDGPDTPGAGRGEPDPDLALLARAIIEKQDLLAAYETTLARHRQLGARLEPLRADHAAHLAALTDFRPLDPGAAPEPSASASPTGAAVPTERAAAVQALAAAELAAAGRRIGQCREARDPQLARLLAALGGSEAAHTTVLRSAGSS